MTASHTAGRSDSKDLTQCQQRQKGGENRSPAFVTVSVSGSASTRNNPAANTERTAFRSVGARGFAVEAKPRPFGCVADKAPRTSCCRAAGGTLSGRSMRRTPCRFRTLTGARRRWFMRVSGWVSLVGTNRQRWALSLTLTLSGDGQRFARSSPSFASASRAGM